MTSGSAQPADDQPNGSSTTPTDGPPSEPSGTDATLPISLGSMSKALEEMFMQGWRASRLLPSKREPLNLRVNASLNAETKQVDLDIQIL